MNTLELHKELTKETDEFLTSCNKPLGDLQLFDAKETKSYCPRILWLTMQELYGDKYNSIFEMPEEDALRVVRLVMEIRGQRPIPNATIKIELDNSCHLIYITQLI